MIEFPNFDPTTGISYGVISQRSLSPYVIDDIINDATDLYYEEAKKNFEDELKEAILEVLNNHICYHDGDPEINVDDYIDDWNDSYQNDEHKWFYEDAEYTLDFSNDLNAIYVCKSPFYTYCRGCSPCCPGAGDLDSIITRDDYDHTEFNSMSWGGAKKAYCLPNDYFEDHKAPYVYFKVGSDEPENVVR
jgi:hypothetical protein